MGDKHPQWLTWLSELQAIAQAGRAYCKDTYCDERYDRIYALAAEIMEHYSDYSAEIVKDLFDKEYGYATPKLDTRAVIFKDNKILLVEERDERLWSLPGGWADVNFSPSENVVREVKEESGFDVSATKLLALFDKQKHQHPPHFPHTYKCFFLCEIIGGEAATSHETSNVGFFAVNDLPPLSVHRVTKEQILHFFDMVKVSNLPTEFD